MTKKAVSNKKAFFKIILTIALPIAMQNLLATTAGMVDTIMIGSQGELAVAAVGICSQISSLFFSCYWGFMGGAILFFSQYWGAKNEKGINRAFGLGLAFVLAIGLGYGVIAVCNPGWMLRIYTDKENIVQMGIPYIRIVGFSYPLTVLSTIIAMLMRSTERIKQPLICSIIALVVNFILNWLLIYGRFGLPKMGPAGAAVGTLASGFVNFGLLAIMLLRDKKTLVLKIQDMFGWSRSFVAEYLKRCFPIICNEFLYGIGQAIINIVIGRQDESAIAAMAAFRVLEGFVFAFFGGLADASSVVVGKEIGAGNHMRGYQYVKWFSALCPTITFAIVAILLCVNQPLLGLFGLGAQALEYGKWMLLIYLLAGTIRTCNYIMNCCYRVGGETVFGTVLEIGCLFAISVPMTWLSGMTWQMPFLAVFAFVYTDEILRLIVEVWYTRTGKWVKPVTDEGRATLPAFKEELAALHKH